MSEEMTIGKISLKILIIVILLTDIYSSIALKVFAKTSAVKNDNRIDKQTSLVSSGSWELGTAADGDLLVTDNSTLHVISKFGGARKQSLLVQHRLNFSGVTAKTHALHVHLQAKADTNQDLVIEILRPQFPYTHSLNETRQLKNSWQVFDFDCVCSRDDINNKDGLSIFFKLKGLKGNVLIKQVSVTEESLTALGINNFDLTDDGIRQNIEKNRKGQIVVEVVDAHGQVVPNAHIQIFQASHKFLFGTEVQGLKPLDTSPPQLLFQKQLLSVFNFATVTPYWPQVEKTQGQPDYKPFDNQIAWLAQHSFVIKLTPAFWPHWPPKYLPEKWQSARTRSVQNLREFCAHFEPAPVKIIENNEVAAAMTDADSNGLISWVKVEGPVKVLEEVTGIERKSLNADKHQILIYNDYENGQTEFDMLDQLQREGQLPDALGLEMHMTQGEWPMERIAFIIQKLSKYGRPIYVSEISIISGDYRWVKPGTNAKDWVSTPEGENRQAEYVGRLYSFLFSCKSIHGITWWDLTDKDAWEGAPRGLLRKDNTPKPAFLLLEKLIGEHWKSNVNSQTDAHGICYADVFAGEYNVSVGDLNSSSKPEYSQSVSVDPSKSPTRVSFKYRE